MMGQLAYIFKKIIQNGETLPYRVRSFCTEKELTVGRGL